MITPGVECVQYTVYSGLVVDLSRDSDAGNVYTALACKVPPEDTLADPGEARGCSINTFVINYFIDSVSQSVILCEKYLNGAVTPKQLKIVLQLM